MRREREANEQRRDSIARMEFMKDTQLMLDLGRRLAVLPIGESGPTPAAMKGIRDKAKVASKQIDRMIRHLTGGKAKRTIQAAPPPQTPSETILQLMKELNRINPALEATANNNLTVDPARNRQLATALEAVRPLLQRLQRPF